MITKKYITILAFGLIMISTLQAQEKKQNEEKHEHMANDKDIYTCSMHPEVKSDKSGESPKCGMALKKIETKKDTLKMAHDKMNMKQGSMKMMHGKMNMKHDKIIKTYTCSMHPEVNSKKPGECPKCGMNLIEKKMDKKNEEENKNKKHNH